MEEVKIGNYTIKVDNEGYMTDASQWNEEVAKALAAAEDLELTEKHMEVLRFLRKVVQDGETLTIRKVGNSGIVDIKEFYTLFPKGPLKRASKYAGIPKPSSCV
ncbi:MAG TPA: TusE/DsrC/DsvC family sulfur relay protein [Bacteroidales bacterium]|nr:TusE/DsrC/DsvC family sulfur relay protein [Bacteroidales bacterium]